MTDPVPPLCCARCLPLHEAKVRVCALEATYYVEIKKNWWSARCTRHTRVHKDRGKRLRKINRNK